MRLERTNPEAQKANAKAIYEFLKAVNKRGHELHSFMLVKNGKVVCERFWEPFTPEVRHELFSLSKSFTSTAIGIAVDEGLLTLDTKIADIFTAEVRRLDVRMDDEMKRMTIRHLLTMSTGIEYEQWSDGRPSNISSFLSAHVKHEPGTVFSYNSQATFMLSAAIQRLTGEKLVDWLTPRLFEPLGIETPYWREDENGVSYGGFGLNLRTEDIAVFGQFLLQKGEWNGKQLVSQNWIEEATKKQIDNGQNSDELDWAAGYGYQFWRCAPDGVYRGDGMYGQFCVVAPEQNVVIAATSNVDIGAVLKLFWKMLEDLDKINPTPHFKKFDGPEYGFSHTPVNADAAPYPTFRGEFFFDGSDGGDTNVLIPPIYMPHEISFDFGGDECLMLIFPYRFGGANSAYLFKNKQWVQNPAPNRHGRLYGRAIINGEWKNKTFTATIWPYETPTKDTYRFTFNDDFTELTAEVKTGGFDAVYQKLGTAKRKQ